MAISVSFPFSWAAQPEAGTELSLGAGFLYHILSPNSPISKLSIGGPKAPSAGLFNLMSNPVYKYTLDINIL